MTRTDFKPIYAKNNAEWRIRYQANGLWELQEWRSLHDGVDRRRIQPWITHNRYMVIDDAMKALGAYDIVKGAA